MYIYLCVCVCVHMRTCVYTCVCVRVRACVCVSHTIYHLEQRDFNYFVYNIGGMCFGDCPR